MECDRTESCYGCKRHSSNTADNVREAMSMVLKQHKAFLLFVFALTLKLQNNCPFFVSNQGWPEWKEPHASSVNTQICHQCYSCQSWLRLKLATVTQSWHWFYVTHCHIMFQNALFPEQSAIPCFKTTPVIITPFVLVIIITLSLIALNLKGFDWKFTSASSHPSFACVPSSHLL